MDANEGKKVIVFVCMYVWLKQNGLNDMLCSMKKTVVEKCESCNYKKTGDSVLME